MPTGVYRRKKKGKTRRRPSLPTRGNGAILLHLRRAMTLINKDLRDGAELRESDCEVRFALAVAERNERIEREPSTDDK